MDKGIFTALSGGLAKSREIEIVANNLANSNTPGFKRDTGTFNEYLTELRRQDTVEGLQRDINAAALMDGRPQGDKSFVEMDGVYTDFRQGNIDRTGRSLDVAIEGKGMFEILAPSGIRYTRQGNFSISTDGRLVTSNGYPVLRRVAPALSEAGPDQTRMDPEQRIIRLGQSPVRITEDGDVIQNQAVVARISVQEFHELQWLEKVGQSYFKNTNPDNLIGEKGISKLHQGFMEGSNVNPVREMTRLIEATRAYESHLQAIKTYQEIDAKSVNDIAISR